MTDDHQPGPSPARDGRAPAVSDRRLATAALAVAAIALVAAAAPHLRPGGDFGGQVRAYLLENPQVLDEVFEARQRAEQSSAADTITQAVARDPGVLNDARDPAVGPADAAVTVVQFFDYRCPGCKAVSADYLALIRANPDVRFVFKEWPILDRGEDVTSQYAARAALAAHAQGRYLPVHQALMATPGLDAAAVDRVLEANGVNLAVARAYLASEAVTTHIGDLHEVARTLGVQGTPTFLVNGRAMESIDPAELARAIAAARRG